MSDVNAKEAIASGWGQSVKASFNRRDAIIYALGTGAKELKFLYENHPQFSILPWYPVVVGFKGDSPDVVQFPSEAMVAMQKHVKGSPSPAGAVLDGERFLEVLKPLPNEGTFLQKSRVIAISDKKTGALVETEAVITDEKGTPYARIVSGAFYVGVTGFESAGSTYSKKYPVPQRDPDKIIEQKTDVQQAVLYRLSGDYNPLHIDPEMAPVFGFKEPILHGLCSFGHSARHVLAAFADNDTSKFKAIKVRFASPVYPGETLVTKMWKEGNRIFFQTEVKERKKVVISDAYVDLVASSKL
jgi:3-hydroxyacyl-CoA dehydrogenase/3a,7a,12a-trihydroxy-5b-cholest-24-enoyl-CoA hydratase